MLMDVKMVVMIYHFIVPSQFCCRLKWNGSLIENAPFSILFLSKWTTTTGNIATGGKEFREKVIQTGVVFSAVQLLFSSFHSTVVAAAAYLMCSVVRGERTQYFFLFFSATEHFRSLFLYLEEENVPCTFHIHIKM